MLASLRKHLSTIIITILYMATGCIFYSALEEKPCESEERLSAPDYDEESCLEPWTIIDALYFSMVTMSTVGYGDLTPTFHGSKVFTCLYIIIGIGVVFVRISEAFGGVLGGIQDLFLLFLERFNEISLSAPSTPGSAERKISGTGGGLTGAAVDLDGDGEADFVAPPSATVYWAQGLFSGCLVLALMQILSGVIFMQLEPGLQFGDAMYHCFVTATTVGYGDVSLTTQGTRLWAFVHIAFCVSFLGAFIGRIGELSATRSAQLQRHALLLRQMDEDLICSLDQDGTGVDKLEFVVGMLIKLGAQLCGSPLEWSDVEPFLDRFDAADIDKSGCLTKEDLHAMVHNKADHKIVEEIAEHFQPHDDHHHHEHHENHEHHEHHNHHDQHHDHNSHQLNDVIREGFQDLWISIGELRKISNAIEIQEVRAFDAESCAPILPEKFPVNSVTRQCLGVFVADVLDPPEQSPSKVSSTGKGPEPPQISDSQMKNGEPSFDDLSKVRQEFRALHQASEELRKKYQMLVTYRL